MAKAIKFNGDTTIDIRPVSKNSTYEYNGSGTYTFTITNSFKNTKGDDLSGYEPFYYNLGIKDGNNLVVTSIFSKQNGSIKKITTTIKNYFANTDANKVTYTSYLENFGPTPYTITPDTEPQHDGLYSTINATDGPYYILGTNKGDPNTMNGTTGQYYFDRKGNDKYYDHMTGGFAYTYDLAGKDTYEADGGGILYTHDFAGNDIYSAKSTTDTTTRFIARDFAGNDEYSIATKAQFDIIDYKGNDKYSVEENAAATYCTNTIEDGTGNDAYTLYDANVTVYDLLGKDTYNIYGAADGIHTNDFSGNDKYNILSAESDAHGEDGFVTYDSAGSDTYNIAQLVYDDEIPENLYDMTDLAGNDKYNFKKVTVKNKDKSKSTFDLNAQNIAISDQAGNDKYAVTIADETDIASDILITDDAGADSYTVKGIDKNTVDYLTIYDTDTTKKDKYNIAWTTALKIRDNGGNDTYTLKKTEGIVTDAAGSDKYTVEAMSNWDMSIIDEGSLNDSYKVNATATQSFVEISDGGGNKDSLVLSGARKSDIVFMVDIKSDNTYKTFGDKLQLFAYNKKTDSLVVLDDFYAVNDGFISDFSTGRIETVKAGSTKLTDMNTYTTFNSFITKAEIAGWLSDNTKGSVYSVMIGSDADAKAAMVAYFSGETPQALEV